MNPIFFQYKAITIYTLWVIVAIGIIAGLMMLNYIAQRSRTKIKAVFNHLPSLFIFGLIGARLVFVTFNWQIYFFEFNLNEFLGIFFIWDRGLSAWGMVIGLLIRLYFLSRKYEENFISWLDTTFLVLIATTIFGNIGAFFEGLNYGNETDLPWGMIFESGMIKYAVPIHPTQLYAAAYSLILTFFLYKLWKSKFSSRPGNIALVATILYSLGIFLEGFVRGDDTIILANLRIEQWLSIFAFVAALIIFFRINQKEKNTITEKIPPKPQKNEESKAKE